MRKLSKVFEKFFKKVARKFQKCIILAFFAKLVKNMGSIFAGLDETHKVSEIFDKFSIIFTIFQKLLARKLKNALFSPIFLHCLKTMRSIFALLDEKDEWLGKILRKF